MLRCQSDTAYSKVPMPEKYQSLTQQNGNIYELNQSVDPIIGLDNKIVHCSFFQWISLDVFNTLVHDLHIVIELY